MTSNLLRKLFSAAYLHPKGLYLFPLAADPQRFKQPASSGWQTIATTATDDDRRAWDEHELNLGLYLRPSRLVVLDSDTAEAESWAQGHLPRTPWITRTAKGRHRFYRLAEGAGTPTDNKPIAGLDRKASGYVLAPGSWHYEANRPYIPEGDWTAPMEELPVYSPAWFPELRRDWQARGGIPATRSDVVNAADRARSWLAHVPGAVSGQGGHLQTYKAALGLVRGFCLDPQDALCLLAESYNPRCTPEWSLADLRHKVESACYARLAGGSDGWLLNARRAS